MNKKIKLTIIAWALVAMSCGVIRQPNAPTESGQSGDATVTQSTDGNGQSGETTTTQEPAVNNSSDINISLIENKSTIADGWVNVEGFLGFYNRGNESVTLTVDDQNMYGFHQYVFLNTEEGKQYPVEINAVPVILTGNPHCTNVPKPKLFHTIPMKNFRTKYTDHQFQDCYFKITYRVPELLHPTNITISKIFTMPDGNTEITIEKNNMFKDAIGWTSQLKIVPTGTIPVTLNFTDGMELEIQPGWVIKKVLLGNTGAEINTYCLNVVEKNTDISDEHGLFYDGEQVVEINLIINLVSNLGIDPIGIINVMFDQYEDNSFGLIGPGQQKDAWLCIDTAWSPSGFNEEDQTSYYTDLFNNPDLSVLLSISGKSVNQLLSIPRP